MFESNGVCDGQTAAINALIQKHVENKDYLSATAAAKLRADQPTLTTEELQPLLEETLKIGNVAAAVRWAYEHDSQPYIFEYIIEHALARGNTRAYQQALLGAKREPKRAEILQLTKNTKGRYAY